MTDLLQDTQEQIFGNHPAQTDAVNRMTEWDGALWTQLAELGLTSIGVPENEGGAGGTLQDAAVVVCLGARHAVPLALAETLLVASALGIRSRAPTDPWTVAVGTGEPPRLTRTSNGAALHGRVARVPWARDATWVTVVGREGDQAVLVTLAAGSIQIEVADSNLAGESPDTLVFDGHTVFGDDVVGGDDLHRRALTAGAAARALQMAGVLEGLLHATTRFASEREQFGGPISRFQVVQQMVAELAAETVAARAVADTAVTLLGVNGGEMAAAAAKVRSGMAATKGTRIAHQIHGAIGFTQEHSLHRLTRRLWSWREEFGSEAYWADRLGSTVLSAGADRLWPSLVGEDRTPTARAEQRKDFP